MNLFLMNRNEDKGSEELEESDSIANLCHSLVEVLESIHKITTINHKKKYYLEETLLANAVIVFSTASTSYAVRKENFDICIVDEASQLVEAHTAQVLRPSLECLVLAGDHLQLPATVSSKVASDRGYEVSLFERLRKTIPSFFLDMQYLMHPEILKFPNKKF